MSSPGQGNLRSLTCHIQCGEVLIQIHGTCQFLTDNELGFVHPGGMGFEDYVAFCLHPYAGTCPECRESENWGFFHLNQDRTDWQMDEIVADCRNTIAEKGRDLECFGVRADATFML